MSTFNYADGSAPTVRIGLTDRIVGSPTTAANGFMVHNLSSGRTFEVANGVWTTKTSNMVLNTETPHSAGTWIRTATVTAIGNTLRPDGVTGNVFRVEDTSAVQTQALVHPISFPNAPLPTEERWCASVYVSKHSQSRYFSLILYAPSMNSVGETLVDLQTGAFVFGNSSVNGIGAKGRVEVVGDFYRVSISTILPAGSNSMILQIAPAYRASLERVDDATSLGSAIICMPQVNPGTGPYQYIATTDTRTIYLFEHTEAWLSS